MSGKRSILFLFVLAACLSACRPGVSGRTDGAEATVAGLIGQAGSDVENQRLDDAMQKAFSALDLAIQADSPLLRVRSLACITGIDIMASRDEDAWQKALEAESIARQHGFRPELAGILISKAKLCSYAEISPETGRNDEGLEYAREALALAEETGNYEQQAEACYVIGSLYINKNRWNDPIEPDLYRTAGEYLDRGQALADQHDIPRLRRNGILFRSRWFQQGDRNEEAIRYFSQVLGTLPETDHLTASSLDDRLVRLYMREGEYDQALAAHDDYVYHSQQYLRQKADETLQEMETRFDVREKERQIELRNYQISLLVLLGGVGIVLLAGHLRKVRRRNEELQHSNDTKEQLINFLARDLRNPARAFSSALEELSAEAPELSVDQIRRRCGELAAGVQSINEDMAGYVGDVLVERNRRISGLGLTHRELEIIRLSAQGLTAAEIAEKLYLSVHTVNNHRQRIYAKMDVRNVSEMTRKATDLGILPD
ncbi:MAG: hypothetical protein IJU63_02270 [Bacteroidales bacterium]|nr:hypothetical protein [Bacteroidales bacterium]